MSKRRSYASPSPSPSSMAGIFTRSRAEIFLHRTRSGHARPDPSRRNLPHRHQLLLPSPTGPPPPSASSPAPPTFISMKDLRAHRVFSPASAVFLDQTADEPTAPINGSEEKGEQNEAEKSNGGDVELSPGCEEEARGDDERIQSTPPDLDMLRKLNYGCHESPPDRTAKASGEERKLAADATTRRPQPNLSKNRPPGIVPCSRSKLYRNPKSFGYRRLLPYLLDLEKDHSGGAEILRPLVHCKKNTEEVPLLMSEDSSPAEKDRVDGSEDNPVVASGESLNVTDNHVPQTFESGPTRDVDNMVVEESTEGSSDKLRRDNMDLSEEQNLENYKSSPLQLPALDVDDMMLIESTEGLTAKMLSENMDQNEKHVTDNSKSNCLGSLQGIVPCSRSKLYRNPKSFGYRRLLPYILDLEKDHSGGAEIVCPLVHSKKIENNTEEVPLLTSEDPSPAEKDRVDGSEDNPIATSGENLNLTDNHVPQTFELGPTRDVDDMVVEESTEGSADKLPSENMDLSEKQNLENYKSSPLQLPAVAVDDMMLIESTEGLTAKMLSEIMDPNEKHVTDNPKSSPLQISLDDMTATEDLSSENSAQAPMVAADDPVESLDLEFLQSSDSLFHIPAGYGALSVEELAGSNPELRSLPGTLEEDCRAVMPTVKSDRKTLLVASQFGRYGPLGNHALAPKKGILKRHTRGCMGLCMCLECASFRLHAERAFEFSRKQIIEADEVVMELTKELSCLRNVMEKSIVPEARELCRRTSRIEELAKIRMGQMIHELNVHYRLPGPRVTFAECIKERSSP